MKATSENKQRELCRRLAEYTEVYPDNRFLDDMHAWGNESGRRFSIPQADAIEDALTGWKRRLNSARYDPDRCPPGYAADIWGLAREFRDVSESQGLPCTGIRVVYQELSRAVGRDRLSTDYEPWRDKDGKPGWVRMLSKVIELFIAENADTQYPFGLCQDLAQPGVIRKFSCWMVEQAKLDMLLELKEEDNLRIASTPPATPERRAGVRAYIEGREMPGPDSRLKLEGGGMCTLRNK